MPQAKASGSWRSFPAFEPEPHRQRLYWHPGGVRLVDHRAAILRHVHDDVADVSCRHRTAQVAVPRRFLEDDANNRARRAVDQASWCAQVGDDHCWSAGHQVHDSVELAELVASLPLGSAVVVLRRNPQDGGFGARFARAKSTILGSKMRNAAHLVLLM